MAIHGCRRVNFFTGMLHSRFQGCFSRPCGVINGSPAPRIRVGRFPAVIPPLFPAAIQSPDIFEVCRDCRAISRRRSRIRPSAMSATRARRRVTAARNSNTRSSISPGTWPVMAPSSFRRCRRRSVCRALNTISAMITRNICVWSSRRASSSKPVAASIRRFIAKAGARRAGNGDRLRGVYPAGQGAGGVVRAAG